MPQKRIVGQQLGFDGTAVPAGDIKQRVPISWNVTPTRATTIKS